MDIKTRFQHPELIFLDVDELDDSMLEEWEESVGNLESMPMNEEEITLELVHKDASSPEAAKGEERNAPSLRRNEQHAAPYHI